MAHFEKNRATKTCSILKWLALNTTILFSTGCLAAASNTAPLAPSALTATATSTSQVSLSFTDNSSNEQGFVIMRSLNSSTGFSQIATLAANVVRFSDAGLSASTPYYYRVAAFRKVKGASVFSAYSNLAAVTTLAQTTPPPPPPTPAPTPAPTTDLSWVSCASENAICSFTGTRQVRYGANGIYNYKTATGSITCDNATFGDPLPGVVKSCDYSTTATSATPTPTPAPTATPAPPPPVSTGSGLPDLQLVSQSSVQQLNVPITFGQVFAQGALLPSEGLSGTLSSGAVIPLQVNSKATYPDGSVRHAIISAVIPSLAAGQALNMGLNKASSATSTVALAPTELLNSGFTASVNLNVGGVAYSASADALLKSAAYKQWLSGSMANEFLASAPFKTAAGVAHPHLSARFAIRSYAGLSKAKIDVVVENDWAYEPAPQNFTYDVQVLVGGQVVYSKTALTHYHHARWIKSFNFGAQPLVHIRHNKAYLIATRAIPYYDPSLTISETTLAAKKTSWTSAPIEPMGTGIADAYMPNTGGRPDLGILPSWSVVYALTGDKRAKDITIGMGNLAGSWPMHYRDRNTDLPMSVIDWPYSTIAGNPSDTINPATGKAEAFPTCGGDCSSSNVPDSSHQPAFNYLPYLVTGDYFQLEELQFWSMYNLIQHNPYYREFGKGLVIRDQVRGQAWSLRTLADVAFITPDNHPLKAQFVTLLANNLDWYNANYTNNTAANKLGVITNGAAIVYQMGTDAETGVAPWQDDFFTQAIGHAADLGNAKAQTLLSYKARFPINRMIDPGYCWILGAAYSLKIRDTNTSPIYTSMSQAYLGTFAPTLTSLTCGSSEMATNLGLKVGEMTGYSDGWGGYPSNMQPALAYGATYGVTGGAQAWQVFLNRSVKPDYSSEPQFAIVPRP